MCMENVYSIYLNSLNLGGRCGGRGKRHFHASCRPEIGIERIQTWHPGIEHPRLTSSGGQNDDFRPLTYTLGGRGMGCRDKYVTS